MTVAVLLLAGAACSSALPTDGGEPPRRVGATEVWFVVRGGPAWGPGATADVTLRLRDSTGRTALVRDDTASIIRVE